MGVLASSYLWKVALAIALAGLVMASVWARPPRAPLPRAELRWPLLGALALYAVGLMALLEHRSSLAVWLLAGGTGVCALAGWLSRGDAGGGPPDDDDPGGERPPPHPEGGIGFDWEAFERQFRAYSRRSRRTLTR